MAQGIRQALLPSVAGSLGSSGVGSLRLNAVDFGERLLGDLVAGRGWHGDASRHPQDQPSLNSFQTVAELGCGARSVCEGPPVAVLEELAVTDVYLSSGHWTYSATAHTFRVNVVEPKAFMTTPGKYNTDVSDMLAVHKALTGALEAAPEYVAKVGVEAERVEVVGSFYENVIEFLHVHHTGEDELIYPVLEERCAESRSELERIDEQHKLLHAPMAAGRSAIATWRAAPSADNAQAVIEAIASIAEPLRPHLAEEEAVMLPIATKWMSPEEWGQLSGHSMMSFRADKPWLMLGLVREQLNQAQRDRMLAGMPPEMRAMWTEQMEPAFDAFITDVRR